MGQLYLCGSHNTSNMLPTFTVLQWKQNDRCSDRRCCSEKNRRCWVVVTLACLGRWWVVVTLAFLAWAETAPLTFFRDFDKQYSLATILVQASAFSHPCFDEILFMRSSSESTQKKCVDRSSSKCKPVVPRLQTGAMRHQGADDMRSRWSSSMR